MPVRVIKKAHVIPWAREEYIKRNVYRLEF